jgi:membrane-bound serine protease (ClpP class)
MIGMYVTAAQFEQALKDVERLKPTVVVLEVDSGGGSTEEAQKIIDLIGHTKGVRFVAYVKKAFSAAAIISLSCKEIYLEKGGTFGGAVSFAMTATGPADIGEKFQSIWRATCRSAAEIGGHQTLLAEGMVDKEIDIQIVSDGGKASVREGVGPTMLKRKGKILTMTAQESLDCGLAAGIAESYDELGQKLGVGKWTKPSKSAEEAFERHFAQIKGAKDRGDALMATIRDCDMKGGMASKRDDAIRYLNQSIQAIKGLQDLGKQFPELHVPEKNMEEAIRSREAQKESILKR